MGPLPHLFLLPALIEAVVSENQGLLVSFVPLMTHPSQELYYSQKKVGATWAMMSSLSSEVCEQRLDEHLLRMSYL